MYHFVDSYIYLMVVVDELWTHAYVYVYVRVCT